MTKSKETRKKASKGEPPKASPPEFFSRKERLAAGKGQGEVQAVVLNSAALQYLAAKRGKGVLQVVGPIFRPYKVVPAP